MCNINILHGSGYIKHWSSQGTQNYLSNHNRNNDFGNISAETIEYDICFIHYLNTHVLILFCRFICFFMTVSPERVHKILKKSEVSYRTPSRIPVLRLGHCWAGSRRCAASGYDFNLCQQEQLSHAKVLLFCEIIDLSWRNLKSRPGDRRHTANRVGGRGEFPNLDAEPEEIFQRHEVNPGGAVRNHPLACAEDAWFFILERSFSLWRHVSLVPLSDSSRAVMKPC